MNEHQAMEKWNGFVRRMTDAKLDDLGAKERELYLVFWYQAEVNNGGHLQYFLNRGRTDPTSETITALLALDAIEMANVLRDALALWESSERLPIDDVEEFVNEALEDEFNLLDLRFSALERDLHLSLEKTVIDNLDVLSLE
ncbi:MAG: DUF4375 domain-containing protein [Pseudomonadota bacterium]